MARGCLQEQIHPAELSCDIISSGHGAKDVDIHCDALAFPRPTVDQLDLSFLLDFRDNGFALDR